MRPTFRVSAQPIPPDLPESSGSSRAYASPGLFKRLSRRSPDSHLGVAIEFPEDRRLGKGKRKSVVVWCSRSPIEDDEDVLYVPRHLLPPYSTPPIPVKLYRHDPIPLSLIILQPVLDSDESFDDREISVEDLDLGLSPVVNGDPTPALIRQNDFLHLRSTSRRLRVLLTEPVLQGSITPETRVILTSHPFRPPLLDDADGSEHSVPRSHLSALLEDFDPDAFLSSSLTLASPMDLPDGQDLPVGEDLLGSWSSSSGSITPRPGMSPPRPETPPRNVEEVLQDQPDEGGVPFQVVIAGGPGYAEEVAWMGIGGLGRAGIFEGDWVMIRGEGSRLVRVIVYEALDTEDDLPAHPILISPSLRRALFPSRASTEVYISPTPFGARSPTLPVASTITLARIATAEGVDKRYEKSWVRALKLHFQADSDGERRLVRRGDIIALPVARGRPLPEHIPEGDPGALLSDSDSDSDSDDERRRPPSAIAYFVVASLSFDPLVPLEEDFQSSLSSKARAGELGCWVDVGPNGATRMVLAGLEKARIADRQLDQRFHALDAVPPPFAPAASRLRDLLSAALLSSAISLSVLLKGARGNGKTTLIRSLADSLGYNVILVECYDIVGDTAALTEGSIRAALEKASSAAPSILLLHCVEALATKSDAPHSRPPGIVKVLEDALVALRKSESGFPAVLIGTTRDADKVDLGVAGVFKQDLEIGAPNEAERLQIAQACFEQHALSPGVKLSSLASQTAALHAIDIVALATRSADLALARAVAGTTRSPADIRLAGYAITQKDIDTASQSAREAYSDSIGAPKIPNVRWEDIGGLAAVKREILETVQLPLDHPELFAQGLKKRSGILLYGPPGTGKTLLAKAVATSCSLNFFSVKGPELLNMYVGESEANVRRIFQRARDASPCIVFMDELDSVAPKRGNQGDSGGVMDRIVSQLLAELDGMSSGGEAQVFVMGATNRPDLLDPALLRPGRFDRMIYLSAPQSHAAQVEVLKALTRKFTLAPELDLEEVAELCPLNYTGADLYAVASDAMLKAMMRTAARVDARIVELERGRGEEHLPNGHDDVWPDKGEGWPSPLTPQYYLARLARPDEYDVVVEHEDFALAVEGVRPSVSEEEMKYYESVQAGFRGVEGKENGVEGYEVEAGRFEEAD